MKETRNFLNNIFKLNDLSAQIKHWKKQHTLQVMQKVFWCCATLGVRPIIANYGWQTWNILGKRWKVLNNLYTWPLILHIRSVNCVISAAWILSTINVPFLNSSPCNTDKGAFLSKKKLKRIWTNIIVLWRLVSSGSSVTKELHLVTKLYRNETQNGVPVQGFFLRKYLNSGNIAKELTNEPVFWIDDADKHFFLSDITWRSFRNE